MGSEMQKEDSYQLRRASFDSSQPQFILVAKSNSTDRDDISTTADETSTRMALVDKETEDVLVEMMESLGQNHPDFVFLLETLGNGCFENDDYDEALQYYRQALALKIEIFGEEHTEVGDTLSSIGSVLKEKTLLNESFSALEAALEIYVKHCSKTEETMELQIKIVNVTNAIGNIYFEKGELAEAMIAYDKALSIARLTKDLECIADSCSNIASVHAEKGNQSSAIEYYHESLEHQVELCGEDDPRVANILNNLGTLYFRSDNFIFAMKSYKQVLKMRRILFGNGHISIADIMVNIALVHEKINNFARAEEIYDEALRIAENTVGDKNIKVANIKSRLGSIHERDGRDESALVHFNSAMDIYKLNGLENDHYLVQNIVEQINCVEERHQNGLVEMFSCFGDPMAMVWGGKPSNNTGIHIF